MLSHCLPFTLVAVPQSGTGIAYQFEMLKHFCPLGPSGLWELSVAPIGFNPSLESSNQSHCFCCPGLRLRLVCCLRIFVAESASPSSFQILSCSSPKLFHKYCKCLVSGVVPNRWKGSLFKLFAMKRCDEGCTCCIGPVTKCLSIISTLEDFLGSVQPPFLSVRKSSYLGRAINSAASCNRNRKTYSSCDCF